MGYKQYEFAKKIGISPSSLNLLEKGHNKPSRETIKKIVEATDCDPALFLLGEDKANIGTAEFAEKAASHLTFDDALFPQAVKAGEKDIRAEALQRIRKIFDLMEDEDVKTALEVMEALGRKRGK